MPTDVVANELAIRLFLFGAALMSVYEGFRLERPYSYVSWGAAALFALAGILLSPIAAAWPVGARWFSDLVANPVTWLILFVLAYLLVRPWLAKPGDPPKSEAAKASETINTRVKDSVNKLRDRLNEVEAALRSTIEVNDRKARERHEPLQTNYTAILRDYQNMRALESRYDKRFETLESLILDGLKRIEAQQSLGEQYMRRQVASLYRALAAIGHRELLFYLAIQIENLAVELSCPTTRGERYAAEQWEDWVKTEQTWRDLVRQWTDLADCYEPGIAAKVHETHTGQLMQKGVAKVEQFPDTEAFIAYKAFWIVLKQWREGRAAGEKALTDAAFYGATTDSRPIMPTDMIGEQNALAPRGPIRSALDGHGEG